MDLGVARFLTLSNGFCVAPLNAFRHLEEKFAREYKKLFRKVMFSANWRKQKAWVNRLHRKIRDSRRDFLHKILTALARSDAVFYAEGLSVRNMSAFAKGTADSLGQNVRAKLALNKSVLVQGWSKF